MPKCYHCTRKNHLLFDCKYCDYRFCSTCVQYEIHQCGHMNDMKETYSKLNEKKLYDHACKKRKLEKI